MTTDRIGPRGVSAVYTALRRADGGNLRQSPHPLLSANPAPTVV